MTFASKMAKFLSIMVYQFTLTSAMYLLEMRLVSFENPENLDATGQCCLQGCPSQCNYFVSTCQRPAGSSVSYAPELNQANCSTRETGTRRLNAQHTLFQPALLLSSTGSQWGAEGVQVLVELANREFENGTTNLIDRFAINVTTQVGLLTEETHFGIFEKATIVVSYLVTCAENFYGFSCDRFCEENCTCDPGYTGQFCTVADFCFNNSCGENQICMEVPDTNSHTCVCLPGYTGPDCISMDDCTIATCGDNQICEENRLGFSCACSPGYTGNNCTESIDDCVNVTCSENQICEDRHLSFTCVCEPGYTGPDCMEKIDRCAEVNCIFGTCEQQNSFYTCTCQPGFTGEFCEMSTDNYIISVSIEMVYNPEGKCADRDCEGENGTLTCDSELEQQPPIAQTCDYYFHYCERPALTPVSYERTEFQGKCTARNSQTIFLHDSLDLMLASSQWHTQLGIQLYMELVDSDLTQSSDELIDRFIINITAPGREEGTFIGLFGLATLDITTEIYCAQYLCGFIPSELIVTEPITTEPPTQANLRLPLIVATAILFMLVSLTVVLSICLCAMKRKELSKVLLKRKSHTRRIEAQLALSMVSRRTIDNSYDYPSNIQETTFGITSCPAYDSEHFSPREDNADIFITNKNTTFDDSEDAIECESCAAYVPERASSEEAAYDYVHESDEYDFEAPYWEPARKISELLNQFKKLKIASLTAPQSIELKELLGRGAFGEVYKGKWRHVMIGCEEPVEEEVAVKTMEDTSKEEDRIKFLQEAVIMGQFNHPNIVKIRAVFVSEDFKIVMELMTKGDLQRHLPSLQSRFPNVLELSSQLLYYSRQVASGMSYLSMKGYVHRDLAARNVLVSEKDVCKIGDFGLSRDLQKEEFYKARQGGLIPVKWTAPEALAYSRYSISSDIWSYGCVLYEIWSLGVEPYHNLTNADALKKILSHYRLPPPPGCPRAVYDIMIQCWNKDEEARPEPYEVCSQLNLPEFRVLKWSDEDIARYSEEARTVGAPLAEGEVLFKEL